MVNHERFRVNNSHCLGWCQIMTTVLLREVFSEKNQQHYPGIVSCGVIPSINFTSRKQPQFILKTRCFFFVFLKAG